MAKSPAKKKAVNSTLGKAQRMPEGSTVKNLKKVIPGLTKEELEKRQKSKSKTRKQSGPRLKTEKGKGITGSVYKKLVPPTDID